EFILLKNTQCKFGPGGQADHLADVKLKADSSVLFTPSPIKVEGTLVLEPFQGPDGNTWSIYRLEAAQVRNYAHAFLFAFCPPSRPLHSADGQLCALSGELNIAPRSGGKYIHAY